MSFIKKTAGSILVVSTLILSALAGLSIATMQNVVTEYQLSTHDQDKNVALQSAQYALSEAKRLLLTKWAPGATPCATVAGCVSGSGVPISTNGVAVWRYAAFAGSSDLAQQPASYFRTNAQATPALPSSQVALAPRFFIIDLGCNPYSKANIYRIIAMGFGASANTTAYAESQLTMPLSGQNSYTNAPTTAVYGVAVTATATPTQRNYNLAASTNSKLLFFNSAGGSCSNPGQSNGTGATCERNCAGEVRVKAYSRYNTNSCTWVYGDWASGTNQSTLTLNSDGSGGTVALSCGPCQTSIAVPITACPTGTYNSCTGLCGCPAGQTWNGTCCAGTCGVGGRTWNCASASCQCSSGLVWWPTGDWRSTGCTSATPCPRCLGSCGAGYCNVIWKKGSTNGGGCTLTSSFSNPSNYEGCHCGPTGTWNGSTCVCPAGQTWNGSTCACPTGQIWNGTACACSGGQTWNSGTSACECPAGTNWNGSNCIACTAGTAWDSGSNTCVTCPQNTYAAAGASSCTNCVSGTGFSDTYSAAGASTCTACPASSQRKNGWPVCCTNDKTWNGTACVCTAGLYLAGGTCRYCPANTYSHENATSCTACPNSYTYQGLSYNKISGYSGYTCCWYRRSGKPDVCIPF